MLPARRGSNGIDDPCYLVAKVRLVVVGTMCTAAT